MTHLTRRELLENSMFAAATASTVGLTQNLAFCAEKKQSSSPAEKLSVAVVGVRGRGRAHISAFLDRKDTEIAYICDPDSIIGHQRVEEIARKQKRKPKFVQDMRKAFEDKSVDIVSIATPNHLHAIAAIWAIQAGKDVYLEKPVSHNVSEGRRIVEAARKHHQICQVGTQSRSNRGMREMMKFIHSGGIGKVKLARGLCYNRRKSIGPRGNYKVPKHINYNLWTGPAAILPVTRRQFHYDWHWQWPYGNGDLGNQGIHQMDLARWGLQIDTISPNIFSYGGRYGYTDAGDTANTQVVVHDYKGKTLVFEVRGLNSGSYKNSKVGVIFEGSEGYLVITSYSSGAAFDKAGKKIKSFSGGGDHFGNFVSALRSRKIQDLNADILQGHLSSALCHTGNISYQLGKEVSPQQITERLTKIKSGEDVTDCFKRFTDHLKKNNINIAQTKIRLGQSLAMDVKKETFTDNTKASQMLTREYRKPFIVPKTADL